MGLNNSKHDLPSYPKIDFDTNVERYAYHDWETGDVLIRDVRTNQELQRFEGGGPPPSSIEGSYFKFSNTSKYLAARLVNAQGQIELRVWDLASSKLIFEADTKCTRAGSRAVEFSADERRLYWIQLTDRGYTLNETILSSQATVSRPEEAGFLAVNERLDAILVDDGQSISVVPQGDFHEAPKVKTYTHPREAAGAVWPPDYRMLAVPCGDSNAYVWDVDNPTKPKTVLEGHDSSVRYATFHPCGNVLATWSWDITCRFWDVHNGRELLQIQQRPRKFSQDGKWLGVEHDHYYVGRYRVAWPEVCRTYVPGRNEFGFQSVDFDATGKLLAVAWYDGHYILEVSTGRVLAELGDRSRARLLFAPDGKHLVAANGDGFVRIDYQVTDTGDGLEVQLAEPKLIIRADAAWQHAVVNEFGVTANVSSREIVHMRDGQPSQRIKSNLWDPAFLDVSPDGCYVSYGAKHGTGVHVADTRTGAEIASLLPNRKGLRGEFSPDGKYMVVAARGKYIIYDVPSFNEVHCIQLPDRSRGRVAFRQDMSLFAVSGKSAVHVFKPESWENVATLRCVQGELVSADMPEGAGDIDFSPDGNLLAVTTREGAIKLWDFAKLRSELRKLDLDWNLTAQGEDVVDN